MSKIIIIVIMVCMGYACRKDTGQTVFNRDTTSEIEVTSDNENITREYLPSEENECSQYNFSGVGGNYFGFTSSYKISNKGTIDITYGTLRSVHTTLTDQDILAFIQPGERIYGSLGAFTSYPQLYPNCAEVSFTDKKKTRWCSTKITEHKDEEDILVDVRVDQPKQSRFIIEKVTEISLPNNKKGFRIIGYFNCVMYEVSGENHKKMKGKFSGIITRNY